MNGLQLHNAASAEDVRTIQYTRLVACAFPWAVWLCGQAHGQGKEVWAPCVRFLDHVARVQRRFSTPIGIAIGGIRGETIGRGVVYAGSGPWPCVGKNSRIYD